MRTISDRKYRKISRDFKGKVELSKQTPLEYLEKMFIEAYNFGLESYIKTESKLNTKKSRKDIIIEMCELRKKLKGRKIK